MRYFLLTFTYVFLTIILYSVGIYFGFFTLPLEANITYWDGDWYYDIRNNGYTEVHDLGRYASCAFYPLFPAIWRFLQVSPLGICAVNGLFFCIGISLFFRHFRVSTFHALLFLATPLLLFVFLPYAEALSFLLLTLFLLSFVQEKYFFAFLWLLLAGLARPILWQFGSVLLVWLFLDFSKLREKRFFPFLFLALAAGLSFLALNLCQYWFTGLWNANVKAYRYWGGHLQWPILPLRTFITEKSGIWIKQLDYLAFAMCLLSILYLCYLTYKRWVQRKPLGQFQLLFAMACVYLFSYMLVRLATMKGDLWSLSRYVFVNPFFAYFLIFLKRSPAYWKHLIAKLIFLLGTQLLFVKEKTLETWMGYWIADFQFIVLTSQNGFLTKPVKMLLYTAIILGGMLVQCYLYHCYLLNGPWVG